MDGLALALLIRERLPHIAGELEDIGWDFHRESSTAVQVSLKNASSSRGPRSIKDIDSQIEVTFSDASEESSSFSSLDQAELEHDRNSERDGSLADPKDLFDRAATALEVPVHHSDIGTVGTKKSCHEFVESEANGALSKGEFASERRLSGSHRTQDEMDRRHDGTKDRPR